MEVRASMRMAGAARPAIRRPSVRGTHARTAPCVEQAGWVLGMSPADRPPPPPPHIVPNLRAPPGARSACRYVPSAQPYLPTTHANVRHRAERDGETVAWWFGGGFDLTPFYPVDEDVHHWHRTARDRARRMEDRPATTRTSAGATSTFSWHRNETRGKGGCSSTTCARTSIRTSAICVRSVTASWMRTCPSSRAARMRLTASAERQFQLHPARPLLEFNLVYDRGTPLFGLQSGGRAESNAMGLRRWRWGRDGHVPKTAATSSGWRTTAPTRLAGRIRLSPLSCRSDVSRDRAPSTILALPPGS